MMKPSPLLENHVVAGTIRINAMTARNVLAPPNECVLPATCATIGRFHIGSHIGCSRTGCSRTGCRDLRAHHHLAVILTFDLLTSRICGHIKKRQWWRDYNSQAS
jgi:hypothetical protein